MPNSNEINQLTWTGIYRAKVTDAQDPKKLGRIKIWIPDTMLEAGVEGMWALPANNPMGGRHTGEKNEDHYFQGSCLIPPKNSWIYIFFESGNPSEPRYLASCNLENSLVLPENQLGIDYHKKWTLHKSRMGRCIIISDDEHDERVEITGKKRKIKGPNQSGDVNSVTEILDNQCVITIDERKDQEKILIKDYKGNYFKFDIEKEQLHINFADDIVIHSGKSITLDADHNINLSAKRNINIISGVYNKESNLKKDQYGQLNIRTANSIISHTEGNHKHYAKESIDVKTDSYIDIVALSHIYVKTLSYLYLHAVNTISVLTDADMQLKTHDNMSLDIKDKLIINAIGNIELLTDSSFKLESDFGIAMTTGLSFDLITGMSFNVLSAFSANITSTLGINLLTILGANITSLLGINLLSGLGINATSLASINLLAGLGINMTSATSVNTLANLNINMTAWENVSTLAKQLISRDAKIIYDNGGISSSAWPALPASFAWPALPFPANPTSFDFEELVIDSANRSLAKAIVGETIKNKMTDTIRKVKEDIKGHTNPILRATKDKLIKCYATKATFEEIASDRSIEKIKKIANDKNMDGNKVSEAARQEAQGHIDNATKQIEKTITKTKEAISTKAGAAKNIKKTDVDDIDKQAQAVYDETKSKTLLESTKSIMIKSSDLFVNKFLKKIVIDLEAAIKGLARGGLDKLEQTINNMLLNFGLISAQLDPEFNQPLINNKANDAIVNTQNFLYDVAYEDLRDIKSEVYRGLNVIKFKNHTDLNNLMETAMEIYIIFVESIDKVPTIEEKEKIELLLIKMENQMLQIEQDYDELVPVNLDLLRGHIDEIRKRYGDISDSIIDTITEFVSGKKKTMEQLALEMFQHISGIMQIQDLLNTMTELEILEATDITSFANNKAIISFLNAKSNHILNLDFDVEQEKYQIINNINTIVVQILREKPSKKSLIDKFVTLPSIPDRSETKLLNVINTGVLFYKNREAKVLEQSLLLNDMMEELDIAGIISNRETLEDKLKKGLAMIKQARSAANALIYGKYLLQQRSKAPPEAVKELEEVIENISVSIKDIMEGVEDRITEGIKDLASLDGWYSMLGDFLDVVDEAIQNMSLVSLFGNTKTTANDLLREIGDLWDNVNPFKDIDLDLDMDLSIGKIDGFDIEWFLKAIPNIDSDEQMKDLINLGIAKNLTAKKKRNMYKEVKDVSSKIDTQTFEYLYKIKNKKISPEELAKIKKDPIKKAKYDAQKKISEINSYLPPAFPFVGDLSADFKKVVVTSRLHKQPNEAVKNYRELGVKTALLEWEEPPRFDKNTMEDMKKLIKYYDQLLITLDHNMILSTTEKKILDDKFPGKKTT